MARPDKHVPLNVTVMKGTLLAPQKAKHVRRLQEVAGRLCLDDSDGGDFLASQKG